MSGTFLPTIIFFLFSSDIFIILEKSSSKNVSPLKTKTYSKSVSNHSWYNLEKIDLNHDISKKEVTNLEEILDIAKKSHTELLPDIPLAGWDIAYTEKYGLVVVEVNISCNFFCGKFNKNKYFKEIYDILTQE